MPAFEVEAGAVAGEVVVEDDCAADVSCAAQCRVGAETGDVKDIQSSRIADFRALGAGAGGERAVFFRVYERLRVVGYVFEDDLSALVEEGEVCGVEVCSVVGDVES